MERSMTRVAVLLAILPVAPLAAPRNHAAPAAKPTMPPYLAEYRAWQALLKEPHPVSLGLWSLCRAPTETDWEAERKTTGLHAQHLIMVYGNASATMALSAPGRRAFPEGAVLAKEKFLLDAALPDGVAFMIRRTDPRFRDAGGWEFSYFPSGGDATLTHEQCASCHRGAPRNDFVFGDYPRRGGWGPQK
jgi:hypothetical protein